MLTLLIEFFRFCSSEFPAPTSGVVVAALRTVRPLETLGCLVRISKEPAAVLTAEEGVEAHVLRKRGWTVTGVADRLGEDRKTSAST